MKNLFVLIALLTLCATHGMAQTIPPYISNIDSQTLEGWWPMEGNATNQVNLEPAAGNSAIPDIDRLGAENAAYDIDVANQNSGQYISLPAIAGNFNGTGLGLTVNLWVQLNLDPDSSGVIAEVATVTSEGIIQSGWRLQLFGGDSLRGIYKVDEANYISVEVPTDLYSSQVLTGHSDWHMITFSKDDTQAHLYVDGVLVGSNTWIGTPELLSVANTLYLGSSSAIGGELQYLGKIDDIAIWERLLSSTEVSTLFNESPAAIAGCTNSNACNFLSNMTVNDGTCSFLCQGCMDPCACNYDQNATTHTAETCVYDCIVDTVVLRAFLDLNNDGSFNTDEGPLANRPIVFSGPDAATVYTDSEGMFVLPVRTGEYAFEIIPYDFWANPSENPLNPLQQNRTFPNAEPDTMTFAFGPEATVQPSAEVDSISTYNYFFSCSFGYGGGVSVVNTGNEAISGTIILTCNPELLPEPDSLETISPDSVALGYAEWNIDTLLPGATALYTFHVDFAPELIEGFFFDLDVQLDSENQPGLVSEVFSLSPQLNCSILPAGLVMAEPEGVGDQNYISAGETVRYRVYYRNDGPGGIDSVRVSVNLNSDQMLLETLDFPYNPVEYVRCLHDDGTIDFVRSAEFIPDTSESNIDAIGYIVFDIQLRDDLEHNELVIVSPTIALNDTVIIPEPFVHTIFRCEVLEGLDNLYPIDTAYILIEPDSGTTFAIDLCASEVNSLIPLNYLWTYPNGSGNTCSIDIETSGPNEVPDLFELTLTISNADLGCNETSVVPVVIPVEEFDASHNIQAYPNPFENRCTVVFTEKFNTIVLYNSLGELIRSWNNQPSSIEIDHNELSSGAYYLVAHSEQRTARKILIAE
jgi:hypothetical protein